MYKERDKLNMYIVAFILNYFSFGPQYNQACHPTIF